jgi:hypothetical protein
MLNEGNQVHNFISSSSSGTVINYGSGSDFLTSSGSGSTSQKLRFLRFGFRFHNTAFWGRRNPAITSENQNQGTFSPAPDQRLEDPPGIARDIHGGSSILSGNGGTACGNL